MFKYFKKMIKKKNLSEEEIKEAQSKTDTPESMDLFLKARDELILEVIQKM